MNSSVRHVVLAAFEFSLVARHAELLVIEADPRISSQSRTHEIRGGRQRDTFCVSQKIDLLLERGECIFDTQSTAGHQQLWFRPARCHGPNPCQRLPRRRCPDDMPFQELVRRRHIEKMRAGDEVRRAVGFRIVDHAIMTIMLVRVSLKKG